MPQSALTAESPSRLERKRARNRDALVKAARELFTRDGFEATTIAHIAEKADLGFGTFYGYFADKEEALQAVLEEAGREMDAVVLAEDNASVPAAEALAHLIERFVAVAGRNRGVLALWWELSLRRGSHAMTEEREPLPIKLGQAVHRIVMRGTATGEFVTIEPSVAAQFISSGLMFVLFPFPRSAHDERALPGELTSLAFRTLSIAAPSAPTTLAR